MIVNVYAICFIQVYYYSFRTDILNYFNGSHWVAADCHYFDFLVDIGSPTPLNSPQSSSIYSKHLRSVEYLHKRFSFSHIIFASSVSVFKSSDDPSITEYTHKEPCNHYSQLKINLEDLHRSHSTSFEVHYLTALCGPSMPNTFLWRCIKDIVNYQIPQVTDLHSLFNGAYPVDLYVSFLLARICQRYSSDINIPSSFLVCSKHPQSWLSLISSIYSYFNLELPDFPYSHFSSTKSSQIFDPLNFTPLYSIDQTVNYLLRSGAFS